jgi:hypothetical protein
VPLVAEQRQVAAGFQVPDIVDWTILPASIIAAAWTDPGFRDELLREPTRVLRERISRWPNDKTFVVSVDMDTVRHFPLPARKAALRDLSPGSVLALLRHELGDDDSFEFQLPPRVIAAAWFEDEIRAALFADGAAALRELGYEPPARQVVVLENTYYTYHLALPVCPSATDELDFEQLRAELIQRFGQPSTKCCASGTCD